MEESQDKFLQKAIDPATSPDWLRRLAASSSPLLRQGVAQNPNTPADLLLELAEEFPAQLVNNPGFDIVLENPNLVAQMSVKTLLGLLERDEASELLLATVAESGDPWVDPWVLAAIAKHPRTPEHILQRLLRSSFFVIIAFFERKLIPENILNELAKSRVPDLLKQIAKHSSTPAYLLAQLVGDRDPNVSIDVANNPNAPLEVLEKLVAHPASAARVGVARNSKTPASLLDKLARDGHKTVRRFVAENTNTPPSCLEKLASDRHKTVRRFVAENPNTPPRCLEQLASDRERKVRRFVAENPNTPPRCLEQLARDLDCQVREAAAKNRKFGAVALPATEGAIA